MDGVLVLGCTSTLSQRRDRRCFPPGRVAQLLQGPDQLGDELFVGRPRPATVRTRLVRARHVWRIGHVRTRNFRTFEPNPHNPVFTPSADRDAWDCDGVLTAQVIEIGDTYYMLYAGKKGKEWQTGLAKTRKP